MPVPALAEKRLQASVDAFLASRPTMTDAIRDRLTAALSQRRPDVDHRREDAAA